MLQELEQRRAELMREIHAVTAAIKAYAETITKGHSAPVKKTATKPQKRTMSAATKKKLSLAAKARWAKIHGKKASKTAAP
jgi:hypothetical protein